jgi:thioredoxin-like negative regulator of GroEL
MTALYDSTDLRALAEIGFLAATTGQTGHAMTIFRGLAGLRPDQLLPALGQATAWIHDGDPGRAAAVLENAPCRNAEEEAIRDAWLGLALQLDQRPASSRRVFERAARSDGAAGELARQLLEHPASSPFFGSCSNPHSNPNPYSGLSD